MFWVDPFDFRRIFLFPHFQNPKLLHHDHLQERWIWIEDSICMAWISCLSCYNSSMLQYRHPSFVRPYLWRPFRESSNHCPSLCVGCVCCDHWISISLSAELFLSPGKLMPTFHNFVFLMKSPSHAVDMIYSIGKPQPNCT